MTLILPEDDDDGIIANGDSLRLYIIFLSYVEPDPQALYTLTNTNNYRQREGAMSDYFFSHSVCSSK